MKQTKETIKIDADISTKGVKASVDASGFVVYSVVIAIMIIVITTIILKNWKNIHGAATRHYKRITRKK